jgi:hypothetical protein
MNIFHNPVVLILICCAIFAAILVPLAIAVFESMLYIFQTLKEKFTKQ